MNNGLKLLTFQTIRLLTNGPIYKIPSFYMFFFPSLVLFLALLLVCWQAPDEMGMLFIAY